MAAWGRLLPDDKDSYTWAVLPSKFSRKILDVATSTSPSCWEESSSLQTMVRGIGIELDILGIQCNVLSKSFNNTCFYVDYFLAAKLLQQSISPEREMEVVLLTSRQLPETLSLQMCQDDRTKKKDIILMTIIVSNITYQTRERLITTMR